MFIRLFCGLLFIFAFETHGKALSLDQAVKKSARDRSTAASTFHAHHIEAKKGEVAKVEEEDSQRSTASEDEVDEEDFDEELDLDLEE